MKPKENNNAANTLMLIGALMLLLSSANAQMNTPGLSNPADLKECIAYALKNQPDLRQVALDEEITRQSYKAKTADWYPQAGLNYNIQRYIQRPVVTAPLVLRNSSTTSISVTQTIFNSDAMLALKTSADAQLNAHQNTQLTAIDVVVAVSKSFYDVLISQQQINILTQDIIRLRKSLRDATLQYEAGTVDKTDYKRAAIALNNAEASRKKAEELLKAKNALLKQQMGFGDTSSLELRYRETELQQEALNMPVTVLSYQARVEYQQLLTQQRLLQYDLRYTKWAYLPTVSLFGTYNLIGQNKSFSKIYSDGFPNSLFGLTLSVPIFLSGKRRYNTRIAQLNLKRIAWQAESLKQGINTEYATALSTYNGYLSTYAAAKENLALAKEVYTTVQLQYQTGVKSYLDVVIAETDLRSAEVSLLDSLYLLLSSKLDIQRATGTIIY